MTVAVAAAYAAAAARTVQAGDSGEFATVMLRGGVPHPPGYPLMRGLGILARGLAAAGVPPMLAASLPCALCGAGAVGILGALLLRLGRSHVAWWWPALVGLSPPFLLHVPDAEVWGPAALGWAAVCYLALACGPRRPAALGLACGLAGAQHQTSVLLWPLALASLAPDVPGAKGGPAARYGRFVFGAVAGLSAYGTLGIAADGAFVWGRPDTLEGLVHHVLRRDFGTFELGLQGLDVPAGLLLGRLAANLASIYSAGLLSAPPWGLGFLALAFGGALARPRPSREPAVPLPARVGLAFSLALASLVFPALANLDPRSPFAAWILERFDLLPAMLGAVALAGPLDGAARALSNRLRAWGRGTAMSAAAAAVLLQGLRAVTFGVPADNSTVERAALAALASARAASPPTAPPGLPRAVLLGLDDHRTFPILYAQAVLGTGDGVLYLDASLLAYPWYRARARARFPRLPDEPAPVRLVDHLRHVPGGRRVAVFVTHPLSDPVARLLALQPAGTVYRVAAVGRPLPPVGPDTAAEQLRILAQVRRMLKVPQAAPLVPPPGHEGHPFASDLAWAALEPTKTVVAWLEERGRDDEARKLMEAVAGTEAGARRSRP